MVVIRQSFLNWRYLCILYVVIGIVVYANSFNNAFVFDDYKQIVYNTSIQSLNSLPKLFLGSTFFQEVPKNYLELIIAP
jgi:hypothetical protein